MVLTGCGPLHVRLTAFVFAVRGFERGSVALEAADRAAPFRLLADGGLVLGRAPMV
ncbi:hypothetical protein [Tomitella gaofuii]|uniref:hypothetical protein n=1 Tax=Tomitella gaofuii TaxID=2760083 RepID=UPI0015FE3F84|nr:hypothetical protein [Tomitella gaofuii]